MFGIRRCEFITLRSTSNSAMMLDFWRLLADNATRSQTGLILTYLLAHTPMASPSVGLSLGRQRSKVQHAG